MREECTFQEVIQRIKPEQTYRCVDSIYNIKEISMNNIGDIKMLHSNISASVSANQKFYLVQKEVDFMDAAKAFMCGKNIRCEYYGFDDKNAFYETKFLQTEYNDGFMRCGDSSKLTFYMITNGKWYIED